MTEHVPQRMCVICRRRFARGELARHVLGTDGVLRADPAKILPGRGWYICADQACQAKFGKFRPKRRPACKEGSRGNI